MANSLLCFHLYILCESQTTLLFYLFCLCSLSVCLSPSLSLSIYIHIHTYINIHIHIYIYKRYKDLIYYWDIFQVIFQSLILKHFSKLKKNSKNKSHVHKWAGWKYLWGAERLLIKNIYRAKWVSLQLKIWESAVSLSMSSRERSSRETWKLMSIRRQEVTQSLERSGWKSCYEFYS